MIRLATLEDASAIIKIGVEFHKESKFEGTLDLNIGYFSNTVRRIIRAPDANIVVLDLDGIKGAAALVTQKCFFNQNYRMGFEQFFWIYPEYRGVHGKSLLKGIEEAAINLGCYSLTMVCLASLKPEATGRFYERLDYKKLEHHYIKVL